MMMMVMMMIMTGEVPKSTQAMFQSLIDDVEKLMNRKSRAQQEENEGRTNAMRMLRHLRDWIQVCNMLTLHVCRIFRDWI